MRFFGEVCDANGEDYACFSLCCSDACWYVFSVVSPHCCFTHTCADNSFGNSIQFTVNNILGTHVLLESAKLQNVELFVHVSTDEVYGEGRDVDVSACTGGDLLK